MDVRIVERRHRALITVFKKFLRRPEARSFYDRFGSEQDAQAFYEDEALDDLVAHAAFKQAEKVFGFGFGTGRFALRLLEKHLPGSAAYFGID